MKGVVIVPTWRRPDFLWACLHRLLQCDGIRDYGIVLSIDRSSDPEIDRVAMALVAKTGAGGLYDGQKIRIRVVEPHHYHGNSYNVLGAYRYAAAVTSGLVILLEEDIFVARGFLRYHEAAHVAAPSCFCVSACQDQNAPLPDSLARGDSATVYERPTYQSLGVSFQAAVVRHFLAILDDLPNYFAEPTETLASRFPDTKIPRPQAEQDGFLGRVLEEWVVQHGALGAIYPVVPRAFHAGFHGYNRSGGKPLYDGTAEDRGRRLLAMTELEMNDRADSRYRDIRVCPLDVQEREPLVLRLAVV